MWDLAAEGLLGILVKNDLLEDLMIHTEKAQTSEILDPLQWNLVDLNTEEISLERV